MKNNLFYDTIPENERHTKSSKHLEESKLEFPQLVPNKWVALRICAMEKFPDWKRTFDICTRPTYAALRMHRFEAK